MGAFMQEGGLVQKPEPPTVKQHVTPNTCWAAALSSWLKACRNLAWTQDELVTYFQHYCTESGLNPRSLPDVAAAGFIRMRLETINKAGFDRAYLYDKLTYSHLYVVTSIGGVGHAVVVHGIVKDWIGTDDIKVMDPIYGKNMRGSLDGFIAERMSGDAFVGWVNYRYD
jgi:hypothetical protein